MQNSTDALSSVMNEFQYNNMKLFCISVVVYDHVPLSILSPLNDFIDINEKGKAARPTIIVSNSHSDISSDLDNKHMGRIHRERDL